MNKHLKITAFALLALVFQRAVGQNKPELVAGIPVNYDEAKVSTYTLPDPLMMKNGKRVTSKAMWINQRRPEILSLFETQQFGKAPAKPIRLLYHVFDKGTSVMGGKAIRKQVTIYLSNDTARHKADVLIYIPVKSVKPSPVLLNISFMANSVVAADSGVKKGMIWRGSTKVLANNSAFGRVNIKKFIDSGIGFATVYYGDFEPDFKQGFPLGIRGAYLKAGQKQPADDEWGAISAWSWGLSRVMDYFEKDKDIDSKRIAVTGASRLGKTALWTGARDQRFALVIASISGEGGAALSRRNFGETVKHITDTTRYFYQFAPNYHSYSDRINELPVDGHMLISLIAPRPLLLQTGDTDHWSDPKGEFLAALAARPVYQLFGKPTINKIDMPAAGDKSMLSSLGYYMHSGGHSVLAQDYDVFIDYITKHFQLNNKAW